MGTSACQCRTKHMIVTHAVGPSYSYKIIFHHQHQLQKRWQKKVCSIVCHMPTNHSFVWRWREFCYKLLTVKSIKLRISFHQFQNCFMLDQNVPQSTFLLSKCSRMNNEILTKVLVAILFSFYIMHNALSTICKIHDNYFTRKIYDNYFTNKKCKIVVTNTQNS